MRSGWQPRFAVGEAVRVLPARIEATVVKIDQRQRAYVIQIDPGFELLCREEDLEAPTPR
jgi:hypothetical protein